MELSIKEIAQVIGGKLIGNGSIMISAINSLDAAGTGEISFFIDHRYREKLQKTEASAVIIREETHHFKGPQVVVYNPELAYAKVAGLFASPMHGKPGISEQAVVHKTSRIGKNTCIYPLVYVGEDAEVGEDTILFPGVFVGERVRIGRGTVIYPNVTILQDCLIGNNVVIHAGTVIGSDGFGFVRDGSRSVKIPQTGIVQIDDHVEIGANNCIDRASLGKTWIRNGVKTDNLVQVAHNVVIGENTIVVAQAALGGSVHVGQEVIIGGQVGISDHLKIGDRAMIGSQSGVAKSLLPGEVVSGTPSMSHRLWLKISGLIKRLPRFNERLRNLEKKIDEIENRQS